MFAQCRLLFAILLLIVLPAAFCADLLPADTKTEARAPAQAPLTFANRTIFGAGGGASWFKVLPNT